MRATTFFVFAFAALATSSLGIPLNALERSDIAARDAFFAGIEARDFADLEARLIPGIPKVQPQSRPGYVLVPSGPHGGRWYPESMFNSVMHSARDAEARALQERPGWVLYPGGPHGGRWYPAQDMNMWNGNAASVAKERATSAPPKRGLGDLQARKFLDIASWLRLHGDRLVPASRALHARGLRGEASLRDVGVDDSGALIVDHSPLRAGTPLYRLLQLQKQKQQHRRALDAVYELLVRAGETNENSAAS